MWGTHWIPIRFAAARLVLCPERVKLGILPPKQLDYMREKLTILLVERFEFIGLPELVAWMNKYLKQDILEPLVTLRRLFV